MRRIAGETTNRVRMDRTREWQGIGRWASAVAIAAAVSLGATRAVAQCDSRACPADQLLPFSLNPYQFFFDLKEKEIVSCAPCVLTGQYPEGQKRDAMLSLALLHLHNHMVPVARAACLDVLHLNPCVSIDPALPAPLKNLFYAAQDSLLTTMQLICPSDFKTIAVGDIENNSQNTLDLDMDKFCRGLQKVIMNDLAGTTCLQVVDRDRLGTLAKERDLNPEQAAKILGAQTYMFGSLLQVGKKEFILTLRLDRTETTEILVSEQLQIKLKSGSDLIGLEKKVLQQYIVPKISLLCAGTDTGEMKKKIDLWFAKGAGQVPDYMAYVLKVGEAVQADESKDLTRSRTAWAEVAALNPFDADAVRRRDMLNSYAQLGTKK